MTLTVTLASRNLFHDRVRLIATVVGIVFSIVLVTVQLGVFVSFERMITTMIDHAQADFWIVPAETKSFEGSALLSGRERFHALSVGGVAEVSPVVVGYASWRKPNGGASIPVFLVGSPGGPGRIASVERDRGARRRPDDARRGRGRPFLLRAARRRPRSARPPRSAIRRRASSRSPGASARSPPRRRCSPRSSAAAPFSACPPARRTITRCASRPAPTRRRSARVSRPASADAEVLTPDEFRHRSRVFWLFDTGAGAALLGSAILGIIVGTIIVAQTLYSSTKDHLKEFATLRAMGSSCAYILKVILIQALLSALVGFAIAAVIGLAIVHATVDAALPVVMTPALTLGLFALTVAMCTIAAISAIRVVTRIDPATVFAQ